MNIPNYKNTLTKIFVIFFVVALPIIFVLASGYLPNFEGGSLSSVNKTMTVAFNLSPYLSKIEINNQEIGSFTDSIRVKDGTSIDIKFQKEGYVKESINLFAPTNVNTYYKFNPLALLPSNPIIITDGGVKTSGYKFYGFFGNNRVLFSKPMSPKIYSGELDSSLLAGVEEVAGLFDEDNLFDYKILSKTDIYFKKSNKILTLNLDKNKYEALDLKPLGLDIKSIIKYDDNSVYILTKTGNLYNYQIKTKLFKLVDVNISFVSYQPENNFAFVIKEGLVYKINTQTTITLDDLSKNYIADLNNMLAKNTITQIDSFDLVEAEIAKVVKLNNFLFVKNSSTKDYVTYSNKIIDLYEVDKKLLIIETDGIIKMLDLYQSYIYKIASIDPKILTNNPDITISYNTAWGRIFLTSATNMFSLIFDINYNYNELNSVIVKPELTTWQQGKNCAKKTINQAYICIKDDIIEGYKNIRLF
jgi:hypothetical protein